MSETRRQPSSDFEKEFPILSHEFISFKEDVDDKIGALNGRFDSLEKRISEWMREERGKFKSWWPVLVVLGGIAWWAVRMQQGQSDQRFTAIETKTAEHSALIANIPSIMSQNADSRRDRDDQRNRIDRLADSYARVSSDLNAFIASTSANEREIETQFDADSQLRNIQWANSVRRMNDFQTALSDLGAKLPPARTDPYIAPNISNRKERAVSPNNE